MLTNYLVFMLIHVHDVCTFIRTLYLFTYLCFIIICSHIICSYTEQKGSVVLEQDEMRKELS